MSQESVTKLYDKQGNLIGALLTADAWNAVKHHFKEAPEERPLKEPIADWEQLKEFWDFNYPVDADVHCECCGNSTENWEADEPRKFHLATASLGGLVAFKCTQCKARVMKRHFKNEITTECVPYRDEKKQNLEARYNK